MSYIDHKMSPDNTIKTSKRMPPMDRQRTALVWTLIAINACLFAMVILLSNKVIETDTRRSNLFTTLVLIGQGWIYVGVGLVQYRTSSVVSMPSFVYQLMAGPVYLYCNANKSQRIFSVAVALTFVGFVGSMILASTEIYGRLGLLISSHFMTVIVVLWFAGNKNTTWTSLLVAPYLAPLDIGVMMDESWAEHVKSVFDKFEADIKSTMEFH